MFIDPKIGQTIITLERMEYEFIEAPDAPDILYAEIGRKVKVYRVVSNEKNRSLSRYSIQNIVQQKSWKAQYILRSFRTSLLQALYVPPFTQPS